MDQPDLDTDLGRIMRAVQEARKCVSESGKNSPKVGAVLANQGKFLDAAYRGEKDPGDHAEFILLEKKHLGEDLRGATVYTTLEPCTTRNHPKVPCATHLAKRGIVEVVVGMLDPDPRIYGKGCENLRQAGVKVRYFPEVPREQLKELNRAFIQKFRANPESKGRAAFDYSKNNGRFTIGRGEFLFETYWSKASDTCIYLLNDPPSIDSVGLAIHAREFSDVIDATIYDRSSRCVTVHEGQIAVLKNTEGYYALAKIVDVKDGTRPPDTHDELAIEYRILLDKSVDFSVPENAQNGDGP